MGLTFAGIDERRAGLAMIRSHEAGSLRAADAGREVRLAGWVARRRDHGGVVFIDLRDGSGIVQVVLREEDVAHELRAEFCVLVTGTVRRRPAGNENPELATGEVEIAADLTSCRSLTHCRSRSRPAPVRAAAI
jgi:aspartyl-tRNA synthetase